LQKQGARVEGWDMEGGMLLKKARSTLDLVATGTRSQKEIFRLLDKMRDEDER
jgi:hypothetical protein